MALLPAAGAKDIAGTSTTARSPKKIFWPGGGSGTVRQEAKERCGPPPPWSGLTSACRHIGDKNGHDEARQGEDHGDGEDLAKA
jgi:hypothetical protein